MKIMIPLDGSKFALEAFAPALDLARRYEGELLLVTALDQGGEHITFEALESYLSSHKRTLAEEVPCQIHVGTGPAAKVILDCAKTHAVDLIVMTPHGRAEGGRWAIGAVADKVMRSAPCAVMIARGQFREFQRILVPLDGTPAAEAALKTAADLAYWGQLELLRVDEFLPPLFGGNEAIQAATQAHENTDKKIWDYLQALAAPLEKPELKVVCVQRSGSPAELILDYAQQEADMIVMTSHCESWGSIPMFGSVTERVVHNSTCPVMVVRGNPVRFRPALASSEGRAIKV